MVKKTTSVTWANLKELLDEIISKEKDDGQNNQRYTNRIGKSVFAAACIAERAIENTWLTAQRQQPLRPVLFALTETIDRFDFHEEDDGYGVGTLGSIASAVRALRQKLGDESPEEGTLLLEDPELRIRLNDLIADHCSGGFNDEHRNALSLAKTLADSAVERSYNIALERQSMVPILLSLANARAVHSANSAEEEMEQYPTEVLIWILRSIVLLQKEYGEDQTYSYDELCNLRWPVQKTTINYSEVIAENWEEIQKTAQYYGCSEINLEWVSEPDLFEEPNEESFLQVPDQTKLDLPKAKFKAMGIPSPGRQENCLNSIRFVLKFPVQIDYLEKTA